MIKVKLEGGFMPRKATEGSACYDLYAPRDNICPSDSRLFVPLGIRIACPPGTCGILSHRSGSNKNMGVFAYGTLDEDYRGLIGITLFNSGLHAYRFKKGERIGQIRFVEVLKDDMKQVEDLDETSRGEGGFGSTGND